MEQQPADRPNWNRCILNAAIACGIFYAVLNSEQKMYIVILATVGTISAMTAVKECPIRLADHLGLMNGAITLILAALLIRAGLGYYNYGLKIIIVVLCLAFAAFSFWEYFTRRPPDVNQASH